MKEFEWCNFIWDERVFPEPEKMLARLKDKGLKISLWINPYIGQKSPLFKEGKENGYFIKRLDGTVWQWDKWQAGLAIVDFTNPEACKWYESKLEALLDMGVDSFKTDFGERIPTDVQYFDRSNPEKMHNYYSYLYNKIVFELLERRRGENEAVVFARSATAGSQKFPVHWGGDCLSNYESMAESLRGGLSFSLTGFGYWSHDIGGFESGTSPDLYKRWTQFGLLSSHSRYHGSWEYKVPWIYDEEAVDVTRKFTKLKNKLMPYIFNYATESAKRGIPMMRPMLLEFEDDETCHYLDRQYMFGEKLLVAPIFNEQGTVRYYVPQGKWTNLLTNENIAGGQWQMEEHTYMTLPLLVRENSIIPFGFEEKTAEYDYCRKPEFHLFELDEESEANIPNQVGEQVVHVKAVKKGRMITFSTDGLSTSYELVLRNEFTVQEVNKGEIHVEEYGTRIKTDAVELMITLEKND